MKDLHWYLVITGIFISIIIDPQQITTMLLILISILLLWIIEKLDKLGGK